MAQEPRLDPPDLGPSDGVVSLETPTVETPKVISLECNWTFDLARDWTRMIPPKYPYRVLSAQEKKEGEPSHDVVINGVNRPRRPTDLHLTMEPSLNRGHFAEEWRCNGLLSRNLIEWHLNKTWEELVSDYPVSEKRDQLSMIISAEHRLPGHLYRHQLAEKLDQVPLLPVDIFGRHSRAYRHNKGPLVHKDEGLFPYKYHLACENCQEPGYFTEKLADSVLAECLTFYWGCPNIGEYIDSRALVILPDDPEEAVATILRCMSENEWERRLEYIRAAKKGVMELSVFPTLQRLLSEREGEDAFSRKNPK